MEAVVVTLAILGILGGSFKEPAKPKPRARAAKPVPAPLPVFRSVAWAPAPPPAPVTQHGGGHIIPSRF